MVQYVTDISNLLKDIITTSTANMAKVVLFEWGLSEGKMIIQDEEKNAILGTSVFISRVHWWSFIFSTNLESTFREKGDNNKG